MLRGHFGHMHMLRFGLPHELTGARDVGAPELVARAVERRVVGRALGQLGHADPAHAAVQHAAEHDVHRISRRHDPR